MLSAKEYSISGEPGFQNNEKTESVSVPVAKKSQLALLLYGC